ncbi:hypothetical protein JVX98_28175 [Ensifer sp. PDNC004]|uniref:hypothetical protein n=1 Tax=Ensifer sp. PDNC004 TaxID=2811423 RepID=UPI0019647437|nr:hypothetical protein [Ensifer sp. PDNC004]QRY68169.1 hypothetical protein JVX98_28175 [Ensifer sp. PDNC004]
MSSEPKRRRNAAYRKGFHDALSRAIAIVSRCVEAEGDDDPAELPARLRAITLEERQ